MMVLFINYRCYRCYQWAIALLLGPPMDMGITKRWGGATLPKALCSAPKRIHPRFQRPKISPLVWLLSLSSISFRGCHWWCWGGCRCRWWCMGIISSAKSRSQRLQISPQLSPKIWLWSAKIWLLFWSSCCFRRCLWWCWGCCSCCWWCTQLSSGCTWRREWVNIQI